METSQPWVTCFLTDILLTYLEERYPTKTTVDYPALFRGVEGFVPPADPQSFLRHGHNWVPLTVLRELLAQCERLTGRKDVAYLAARAYFEHGQDELLTLFEIIFRVLNDVRSVVLCSHRWAAVQTNHLRLQSFETPSPARDLYMLAQFSDGIRPAVGSIHFVRGLAEGFARLYSFIEDLRCIEEISQLRIEDIVREFPDHRLSVRNDQLAIHRAGVSEPIVEARRVALKSETVPLSPDILTDIPDVVVKTTRAGTVRVLTNQEETDPRERPHAPPAYCIMRSGTIGHDGLTYAFEKDRIYDAPYSRFRFAWTEKPHPAVDVPVEQVRRQVSELLFQYLKQVRHAQSRMMEFNIERSRLVQENIHLRREVEREYSFAGIVGQSKPMQELFALIRSLAQTDVSVLIQGETGTGKELIARAIHYNSPRRSRRFVAVNCGALAETLLQSELFGHERGAFTGADARRRGIFEVADGGTLFLDEIGEISTSTQVKLLRVLQDGEFQRVGGSETIRVNVRILSATNQNVEELVKTGRFRQDLYYRVNVFPIRVPPLRERAEDIPLLVNHFIETANRKLNKSIRGVTPDGMSVLIAHQWPGNVRELENVVQRTMVVAKGDVVGLEDVPRELRGDDGAPLRTPKDLRGLARASTELVEKQTILDALAKTGGNVTHAAKALGISRATLQNKMKAYGLRHPAKRT
jgi:two-component system NtrC family response regulator/two-component system response regulator AtoC